MLKVWKFTDSYLPFKICTNLLPLKRCKSLHFQNVDSTQAEYKAFTIICQREILSPWQWDCCRRWRSGRTCGTWAGGLASPTHRCSPSCKCPQPKAPPNIIISSVREQLFIIRCNWLGSNSTDKLLFLHLSVSPLLIYNKLSNVILHPYNDNACSCLTHHRKPRKRVP